MSRFDSLEVWLKMVALVVLYLLLAKLVLFLFGGNDVVGFSWLASGVALPVVLLGGYRYLPAVFLGALMAAWLVGKSPGLALAIALGHAGTVYLGIWLLKRDARFDPSLSKLDDYLRILVLALGFGLITAVFMQVMGWLTPLLAGSQSFTQRVLGNALSIVLIMPLILVWRRWPRAWAAPRKAGEMALIIGISLLLGQIVFLGWFQDFLGHIARGYWMFPIVAWAAVRSGPRGTVVILPVIALQALIGARSAAGFASIDIAQTPLENFFFYMTSLSTVGMALATYASGHERVEAEILATKNQLQATLDAIPDRLFEVGLDGRYYSFHFHHSDLLPTRLNGALSRNLLEVLSQEAAEVCMSALQEASEKGWSMGKTFVVPQIDGERRYELSVSVKAGPAGPDRRFIVIARDVTERMRDEEKLRASEAALHELASFLQRVREDDRARFARELHDELGQNLSALRIDFDRLANELATAPPLINSRLAAIDGMIDATVEATRRICEDLRPAMLDDLGLEAALASHARRFSKQSGIPCDLSLDREDYGLDSTLSTAIFRIVQESLTNIARHARASHAMVTLEDRGDDLLLSIGDDGCGMSSKLPGERRTHGLLGIRERVKMFGGRIDIDSSPERGTHIEISIPRTRELPR